MENIECITLDDSDEDIKPTVSHLYQHQQPLPQFAPQLPVRRPGSRTVAGVPSLPPRQELMTRCNFCVDPGLLPVETDRAGHR